MLMACFVFIIRLALEFVSQPTRNHQESPGSYPSWSRQDRRCSACRFFVPTRFCGTPPALLAALLNPVILRLWQPPPPLELLEYALLQVCTPWHADISDGLALASAPFPLRLLSLVNPRSVSRVDEFLPLLSRCRFHIAYRTKTFWQRILRTILCGDGFLADEACNEYQLLA